jgi:hypothetical protein
MTRHIIIASLVAAALLLTASRMAEQVNNAVLTQLGISPEAAPKGVWYSINSGTFSLPRTTQLKNLPKSEQAKAGRDLMAYAKSVTATPEFLQWYKEEKEGRKPSPPEPYKSMADQKKEMKESMSKSIAETEKGIAQMGSDQKDLAKMMRETVASMKEQMKSLDDPKNPMFTPEMEKMNKDMYDQTVAAHKAKVAEWEAEWPPTPDRLVAGRLNEFIALTKEVDFNAKLTDGPKGLKVFADQAYESKPSQWKMCYRAGKEASDAARQSAEQWLKEMK